MRICHIAVGNETVVILSLSRIIPYLRTNIKLGRYSVWKSSGTSRTAGVKSAGCRPPDSFRCFFLVGLLAQLLIASRSLMLIDPGVSAAGPVGETASGIFLDGSYVDKNCEGEWGKKKEQGGGLLL